MFDEPHAIAGAVKLPSVAPHSVGVHDEHDRMATPPANRCGRSFVGREVYVVAAHLPKTVLQDLREIVFGGSVVERGWRLRRFEAEVDGHTVALLRPDPGARLVEGEAFLVVLGDDLPELFPAYREPPAGGRREQFVHRRPAAGAEFEPKLPRPMPQVLAQIFTQAYEPSILAPAHGGNASTEQPGEDRGGLSVPTFRNSFRMPVFCKTCAGRGEDEGPRIKKQRVGGGDSRKSRPTRLWLWARTLPRRAKDSLIEV